MPLSLQIVSGPIGAGKSSILRAIQACTQYESNVHVFVEDTDAWQYYLERFYADPIGYGFLFQKEVEIYIHNMTKRLEQLEEQCGKTTVVAFVERSPLDVLHVFLTLNADKIPPPDLACLVHAMTQYANRPVWKNAQYSLIWCPPRVCIDRIAARDRKGEDKIDVSYVERVNLLYEELAKKTNARVIKNYGRQHSLLASVSIVTQCLTDGQVHP